VFEIHGIKTLYGSDGVAQDRLLSPMQAPHLFLLADIRPFKLLESRWLQRHHPAGAVNSGAVNYGWMVLAELQEQLARCRACKPDRGKLGGGLRQGSIQLVQGGGNLLVQCNQDRQLA
jgi:hypothetical protein